jgi:hypothetical protein
VAGETANRSAASFTLNKLLTTASLKAGWPRVKTWRPPLLL